MPSVYSTSPLRFDAGYIDFSTLRSNAVYNNFWDNENHTINNEAYEDVYATATLVSDAYYVWAFGGWGFKFDDDGNAIAGTVADIAIVDYDAESDDTGGTRLGIRGIKASLKQIDQITQTDSITDDAAFWEKVFAGNDVIELSDGDDLMVGLKGNDILRGNDGDDTLIGGLGNDTLTGGAGADLFAFDSKLGKKNIDTITDFDDLDLLCFDKQIFTSLDLTGLIAEDQFVVGPKAVDTNDFFIYQNGTLFYDVDGSGKKKALAVVSLTGAPDLTYENLFIYQG